MGARSPLSRLACARSLALMTPDRSVTPSVLPRPVLRLMVDNTPPAPRAADPSSAPEAA